MTESTIKPTTFSNGPSDSPKVADAYDPGSVFGFNVDLSSSLGGGGFSIPGLPPGKISETLLDGDLTAALQRDNLTLADAIRNVKNDLPPNASLDDVLKSNSLSDVIATTKRLTETMDPSLIGSLAGDDVDFLIKETGKLTNSVIIRDGKLTLDNLKDASGFDYAVTAAVGVYVVKKAMTSEGREDLLGMIAGTKLPSLLQNAAMDSIMDLAAEYGLEDVVSSLIDVIGDRMTNEKRTQTAKELLKGFKYSDKPVITSLSTSEKSLITDTAEFFGASSAFANLIGETAEGLTEEKSYPTKAQQGAALIDALNKVDPNWNKAIRNGTTISKMDNYRYASRDAQTALAYDPRTKVSFVTWKTRKYRPTDWKRLARKQYRRIYL